MHRGSAASFHDPSSSASSVTELVAEPAPDPLLSAFDEPRNVLVAGASGFLGKHLLTRLQARGHLVRGLCRRPPPASEEPRLGWWAADVTDPDRLAGAARDCHVLVNLVGIAEESGQSFQAVHCGGTRNLLAEARRAGVERFVFVSASGAHRGAARAFCRTKHEAEEEVRAADVPHVIFRPSVIYGPHDHFTTALVTLLKRLPVFPVLGVGSLRLQPVAIEDVTDAFTQAVERPDVADRTFELAGPERLKFTKIVRIVARTLGLHRPVVNLPMPPTRMAVRLVERFGLPAPLTPQQLDLFREAARLTRWDNPLRTVFRLEPLPFRVAVADYI